MIAQFRTLGRVKRLREETALRALQAARAQVAEAEARLEAARLAVEESARTLPQREAAIYAEIMRRIVGVGDIDATKGKVQMLMEEHQALIDRHARARDHLARAEAAAEAARAVYAQRRADVEKIDVIATELIEAAAAEATAAEEAEIEDLFSRPRRRPGEVAA